MIYRVESKMDGGVYFATERFARLEDRERWLLISGDGSAERPLRRNVEITEVAEEAAINDFAEGDTVVIRKYGSYYTGTVVRKGTKRLDVEFTTIGGKTKIARSIPACECRVPGKTRW